MTDVMDAPSGSAIYCRLAGEVELLDDDEDILCSEQQPHQVRG